MGPGQTDLNARLNIPGCFRRLCWQPERHRQVQDVTGGRRITAEATANGLGIGNDRVDGSLRGQTTADIALRCKARTGWIVQRLDARNPQLQVSAPMATRHRV